MAGAIAGGTIGGVATSATFGFGAIHGTVIGSVVGLGTGAAATAKVHMSAYDKCEY